MRTIADIARLFDVDRDLVKQWTVTFAEHLSPSATPRKGSTRYFTESDTRVLALVNNFWEDEPDLENIHAMLNSGEQHEENYVEFVRHRTPLFQEVPDDLDETWNHGVLFSSMWVRPLIEVARAYKYAADELVKEALACSEPHLLDYPILYTYRHTLELYLKIALADPKKALEHGHDLVALVKAVEQKHGRKVAEWVKTRLNEINDVDPLSDLFRYADEAPQHRQHVEMWIDFNQLKSVMDSLCDAFESRFLRGY
jgi:DNA-binding transcriptional MerR regulator